MSLDTDQLIAEVASKYGIVISADDPIIAVVALNDVILDQHTTRSEVALIDLEKRLKALKKEHRDQSRDIASTVIGAALNTAKQEIHAEALRASKVFTEEIRQQLTAAQANHQQIGSLEKSNRIAWSIAILATVGVGIMALLVGPT